MKKIVPIIDNNVKVISPQEGPQMEFLSSDAEICVYGGSAGGGKSYALLMAPLRHIETPRFNCTIFRKTSPQIRNAGGLWDTSVDIYKDLKGKPTESRLTWKWPKTPSGSEIRFAHMEYESDKYNFDGSQICMLCFDELQHFSEEQFFYMLSRNRSACGVKPCVKATCNPDVDSFLRKFIDWYIGDDGLPIKERSGVIRYFMRVDGVVVWANSKNELLKHNTEFVKAYEEIRAEYQSKREGKNKKEINKLKEFYTTKIYKLKGMATDGIKSFTFISSSIFDNKILLDTNPTYLANLKALPLVERERLLNGNWNVKPESGKFFNRSWFDIVEEQIIPLEGKECRFWDFAATAPSSKNKDPDFTVGVKIRKIGVEYFIIDVVRVRLNPAELEKLFLETVQQDRIVAEENGIQYCVRWEQEGGSSGKKETYRLQSLLAGYDCRGVPTGGKNKETRARALAIQAEIGNVKLMRGSWNDQYLGEMHMFTDPTTKHDDVIDGSSGSFNELCTAYIHPTVPQEDIPYLDLPEEERKKIDTLMVEKRVEAYNQLEDDFMNGDDF